MSYSIYEAAADYDARQAQGGRDEGAVCMVIDTAACGLGLCRYERGGVTLLGQVGPLAEGGLEGLWIDGLCAAGADRETARRAVSGTQADKALWDYYASGKKLDGQTGQGSISLSQLDDGFRGAGALLEKLLDQGLDLVDAHDVDEFSMRILAVGPLAERAPVRYVLKKSLAGDPFMPDRRFVSTEGWPGMDMLLAEGERLRQTSRTAGEDVFFLWDGDGPALRLAKKDQPLSQLDGTAFSETIFISAQEKLRFWLPNRAVVPEHNTWDIAQGSRLWRKDEKRGQVKAFDVPCELDDGRVGLVQLACVMEDRGPVVLLRRVRDKQVFRIEL